MITKERITNVVLDNIDLTDSPDFVDSFVESCDIDGIPATEEQLDAIGEDYELTSELVQSNVWDQIC